MFENITLFSSLSKAELDTLSLFCQIREYSSGEHLFFEGNDANAMYILENGLLEVYNSDEILGVIKSGEFVGEMAVFSKSKKRSASVKVIEKSKVIILLDFSIKELTKKHPEIIEKIKAVISERTKQNRMK